MEGPYANKDFYNFITTSELPRHRWYYFKEGFSVGLIHEAINSFHKKKPLRILDPFNGSGTTVLTSALLGHYALGIEVNPFLQFTSKIKTSSSLSDRGETLITLNKIIKNSIGGAYSDLEGFSTFTHREGIDQWLFNTSVIRRYTSTLICIDKYANPKQKDIFRFAALIAAIKCSNAKRDGKSLRYKKNWKELSYSYHHFEKEFKNLVFLILDDSKKAPIDKKNIPLVILSDSRMALANREFQDKNFDLVITSPPYLNSFDYTDIYRAELFLGGFIKDNNDLMKLRLKTLRSHVQARWNEDIKHESAYLLPYFEKISQNKKHLWNQRIPLMIKAYFDDINSVLANIKPKMNKKGQIWFVVSTSSYAGVHIPVDLIIGELAHELGFNLKGIHCLRYLRTSSQQYHQLKVKNAPLRESLIILEKN